MTKFLFKYKVQLLFTLLGIIIGFFIQQFTKLTFDNKIDAVEFANLFLTLIIALLIGLYIEPRNQNSRIEKDLHIEQLKQVREIAKEIQSLMIASYEDVPLERKTKDEIVRKFKTLSNSIDMALNQAQHSDNSIILQQKQQLIKQMVLFKKSFTGGGFLQINFSFKKVGYQNLEMSFLNFLKVIDYLIFDINKSA